MTSSALIKQINLDIIDLLTLDIDCPLNIHIVDSEESGLERLPEIIKNVNSDFIIGTPTGKIRHKIAFHHNVPIDKFSIIVGSKNPLITEDKRNKTLILWDYLNCQDAKDIVFNTWQQIELIVILKNLVSPHGVQNFSLYNLVVSETLI